MGFDKNEQQSFFHRYAYQLLLGGMALLLAVFLGFVHTYDVNDISKVADETLGFLRSVCQRYDGYAAGSRAATLKDIYDKTNALASLSESADLLDAGYLRRYAQTQGVTGVVVTDSALSPAVQIDLTGADAYTQWADFLKADNKRDILKYRNKSYSGVVEQNGQGYEVAIVSRRDAKGLVLCYKASGSVSTDIYKTSLEKTLDNNTFHKNPSIVITDGQQIIASNISAIPDGTMISDCPIQQTTEYLWGDTQLVRLRWQGASWYGKRMAYAQYYLYVFYPSNEVFDNVLLATSAGIAVYLLLCLILLLMQFTAARKYRIRDRRQLNTIRAISSLFVTTSILHLDTNRIEGIVSTPRAQEILSTSDQAEQVITLLTERVIAPEYGQKYRDFLDFLTIADRLQGKTSVSDVVCDVNGTWFGIYLIPMEYTKDGRLKSVLFASRSIDEYMQKEKTYQEELRRAARDAELANAAKGSFLRRMSHDLRTPINGIRGMATMTEQSLHEPEKARTYIEKIIASSDYLQSILEDILRMSKLESGKVEFEKRSFDLLKIIADTQEFISERADESNIHFTLEKQNLNHTRVIGSPVHLRQVLQNILSNAVKFTPAGGSIHAVCREASYAEGVVWFEFVCADTGIGMTEEFQKHIFEPFMQEDNSARSAFMGTGLGLPIAKEILDGLGGTISVQSRRGEGSVFTVRLPLKVDAEQPATAEPAHKTISGTRVLLVEDNEINMEVARYMLESRGAVVTGASNGRDALNLFAASAPNTFDVILMDIMMPEMDGLEATRRIRALPRTDAEKIPIFAMTANAFVDDIKMSKEAGMNEHLTKPLDIDEITTAICRYCHH